MVKASDNSFPSILITEGTEPSAPAAGKQRLYIDSTTHKLKRTDSSGTDVTIESAAGSMATDALWDAAGDLAVGSGADTAAKLTIGAAGGVVARINGSVAWNAGTAFPTAAAGDRYYRTNVAGGVEFYYDGTRWVTLQLYRLDMPATAGLISATGTLTHKQAAWGTAAGFTDMWIVDAFWGMNVGATNDGAKYWTLDIYKQLTAGSADASIGSGSTISLTASQNHLIRTAVNALAGGTAVTFYGFGTKVSTPSNIQGTAAITYRMVAT